MRRILGLILVAGCVILLLRFCRSSEPVQTPVTEQSSSSPEARAQQAITPHSPDPQAPTPTQQRASLSRSISHD
jgi:hypothetical protein